MSFKTGTATDFLDLLATIDTSLTAKGSAFGLTYVGTGDGTFTAYGGGASSVAETFTITATSSSSFDVVGSVTGSIGPATVGTPFSHATIEFTITAGGTPFVSGDEFILSTAPKWTGHRAAPGALVTASQGNSGKNAAQNVLDGKSGRVVQATLDDRIYIVNPVTMPVTIEFDLKQAFTVDEYRIARYDHGSFIWLPEDWTFEYWDGGAWQVLDTQSGVTSWGTEEEKVFAVGSPVSAQKYRLNITKEVTTGRLYIGAVRLLIADGTDVAFGEYIWEAPGNDGNSAFFMGIHPFQRIDVDYFNYELASFDGFNAALPFRKQAGVEQHNYVPLHNTSIPYWIVWDGRRVMFVAKIGSQYEFGYLGSYDAYFTPNQWPYPVCQAGSLAMDAGAWANYAQPGEGQLYLALWNNAFWRWSNSSDEHRAAPFSDRGDVNGLPDRRRDYQLRARNLDGSWSGYEASREDVITAAPASDAAIVWPTRCGAKLFDKNIDGSYSPVPVMLCHDAPNILGELSGVGFISGQDLTAETLLPEAGAPRRDWLVVLNIFRSDRDDFFAVALD